MNPLNYTTSTRRGAMKAKSNLIMRVIMALMMIVVGLPVLAQTPVIKAEECRYSLYKDGNNTYIRITELMRSGEVYVPDHMSVPVGDRRVTYPVYVVCTTAGAPSSITFAPGIKEVLLSPGYWMEKIKFEGKHTKVVFNFTIPDRFDSKFKEMIFPEEITEFGGFKYLKYDKDTYTNTFYDCNTLTNVRLPKKLRKIVPDMFHGCTGLTSIDIPESVKVIGSGAFYGCTNIVFPDGLPFLSQLDTLGNRVFARCRFTMENITIPKNLKDIHLNTFQACNITNLTVEEGVEEVGLGNAFITNLTLPKSVHTLYGEMASGIETFIVHPDAPITELQSRAFKREGSLRKVRLPKAIKKIDFDAFYLCEKLEDINLEELSLTEIRSRAFAGCRALPSVVLPKTVQTIEDEAFYSCQALKSFTFNSDVATIGKDVFKFSDAINTVVFPEKFTHIPEYLFFGHKALTNVTWPKTLESIGSNAFSTTSLASIELPETVTSIGVAAFAKDSALTRFVFPKSIKKVEDAIFMYCPNLSEVVLPEACTEIGGSVFCETNIKELVIPEGVTTFGPFLCYRCKSLEHAILPSTLTDLSLGQDAFEGCTALKYIVSYAETAPKSRRDMCDDEVYANATLCIPQNASDYWSGAWEKFKHWKRALGIPTMQNPKSSNEAEIFTEKFMLTLTNPNEKGKIYYKRAPWDFSNSNEEYTEYTEPIEISESCTIWAYVKDGHYASEYTMFKYKYEDPGPTGIEVVEATAAHNDVIYNMQGVRVARPTAPGIYIVNGKKVVVK